MKLTFHLFDFEIAHFENLGLLCARFNVLRALRTQDLIYKSASTILQAQNMDAFHLLEHA